ncbi:maleylpyruvate isomerase family mycothiol-dependent enzyme [Streptomyces bobili]|uniref:Maleylpyruvate isomerase family mycothiol-dependent enzyme n=1 Tax=Streptomyces bobili TaxID=67280 RepID=A0ABZ1R8G5_9ACTN|nr:maleylpyruvate isomerase family mycothiol-dependent enzyme [Streptomyces bobili]
METIEFIRILDQEGRSLAAAAGEAGSGAKVPTCPDWQVRDLLRHTGMVHRWATSFVAEGRTEPHPVAGLPDLDGGELLDWFRTGHRRLVDVLASAPGDVECWHFLPAPSPLAFWARRQAHETAVHRVDAESARGVAPEEIAAAFPRDFAADGIDELLCGFHARAKSKVRTEEPRVLRVRTTDADADADADDAVWTVRLSAGPPVTERGSEGDADCELSGPASLLYLSLWNRLPYPAVSGDALLARLWREKSAVI